MDTMLRKFHEPQDDRVWGFSRRIHVKHRELTTSEPYIYRLPPELIQMIANEFLEPWEAALLAYCNKKMFNTLGRRYWQTCQDDLGHGNRLLAVLAKDLTKMQIHCSLCAKFHPANIHPIRQTLRTSTWKCQVMEQQMIPNFGAPRYSTGFGFTDVQCAIKRAQLGLDHRKYLEAFSQWTRRSYKYYKSGHCYTKIEARIISGELLLRTQRWRIYPALYLNLNPPWRGELRGDYDVCWHTRGAYVRRDQIDGDGEASLEPAFPRSWDALPPNSPQTDYSGRLRRCPYCHSEFHLDVIQFVDVTSKSPSNPRHRDQYFAVVTTVWANFGTGAIGGGSGGNADTKYEMQFRTVDKSWAERRSDCKPADFELGSIKTAFEQGKKVPLGEVLPKFYMQTMLRDVIEADEKWARNALQK